MAIKSTIIIKAITSANLLWQMVIKHHLPHQKLTNIQKTSSIIIWLNIKKFKIIYINIPHTPSKVGVIVRIIFSLTLDEAMSVGLAKACA